MNTETTRPTAWANACRLYEQISQIHPGDSVTAAIRYGGQEYVITGPVQRDLEPYGLRIATFPIADRNGAPDLQLVDLRKKDGS